MTKTGILWVVLLVCIITIPAQLVRSVQNCQTLNRGHLQGNIRAEGLRRALRYDAAHEADPVKAAADLRIAKNIHDLNPSSCLL